MIHNIVIGGAAGLGMETMASILGKILQRKGFEIFVIQDYMSRVRGGHNFFQIRFASEEIDFQHAGLYSLGLKATAKTIGKYLSMVQRQSL